MTAYRLPVGAVLLDGADLETVAYCARVTQRARRRNGLPPLDRVAALLALVAATGQSDSTGDTLVEPEAMTTSEAAALLGCSTRTATRLAPKLGGRLVGGRWLIDRLAIAQHHEGMTA